jgi:hypothetical protein
VTTMTTTQKEKEINVEVVTAYPVAVRPQHTIQEITTIGQAYASSGMFPDIRQQGQAIVKIMAGQEMGVAPFASMTGIHIIQGKAVIGANLMADRVKASGKYDYRVLKLDDNGCELEFYQGGKPVGRSAFTEKDAKAAGLHGKDNWKKYARNMYFARALSNGQRWYAPDVFNGATVYTPDELGQQVDDEGNTVLVPSTAVLEASVEPVAPAKEKPADSERVVAYKAFVAEMRELSGKDVKWFKETWKSVTDAMALGPNPEKMDAMQFAATVATVRDLVTGTVAMEAEGALPADEIPYETVGEQQ